jgi:DNA-binding transcriptional ArsR family regulator
MTGEDGSTGSDGDVIERQSADEAFEMLSNGTRLRILRCLFETDGMLTFSALRECVGLRDSGQFNYHLDKLIGTFVRSTDDGYELTTPGRRVVGAILAGEYTKTVEGDPVGIGADCQHCGGPLCGFFEENLVRIACGDCDRNVISLHMPAGAFEAYPREKWPLVAERWTRLEFETARAGFCPTCRGPVDYRVVLEDTELHDVFEAAVEYSCRRCSLSMSANPASSVVPHPAVVGFHHEHGIDIEETPVWELEWPVRPTGEVVSESPVRVEVPIELGGDRLVLVLDGDAAVVEERRE